MSNKIRARRIDNEDMVCGELGGYYNGNPIIVEYDRNNDKITAYAVKAETIEEVIASDTSTDIQVLGL